MILFAFAESEICYTSNGVPGIIVLILDSIFSGKLHELDIKYCPLAKLTDSLHYQDTRISMGRQRGPAILVSILIFFLSWKKAAGQVVYDYTVYVDNSDENATDNGTCGTSVMPCLTISFALTDRVSDSTQVVIKGGRNYVLNQSITLTNYTHIAIATPDSGISTTVTCVSGAGLSFVKCNDVILQGLVLLHCSALQESTSRNFSDQYFSFMQFPVAVYFLFSQNINLTSVRISESSGTGMAVYATGGHNYIHHCNFTHNGSPDNNTFPSGGGLYIEFPFCNPQLPEDCEGGYPEIMQQFFTDVEFEISNCQFEQNVGHMWHPIEYIYLLPHDKNHLSFGNGGGLSIFFSHANSSTVTVTNSLFKNNSAEWGGGLFVEYQEMSWNNSFVMNHCVFKENTAIRNLNVSKTMGGGGMKLGYIFYNHSVVSHNSMQFFDCTFQNNTAFWGGGALFNAAREKRVKSTNTLEFHNCSWIDNRGRVGSALDTSVWAPLSSGSSVKPKFTNCRFIGNDDIYTTLSPLGEPIGVGTLNTKSISVLFETAVLFERNNRSAIAAVGASVDFLEYCFANFTRNSGRTGGAISLYGSAFIRVHDYTTLTFTENSATQYGGAIYYYALDQHEITLFGYCFIQFSRLNLPPWNWTASFLFRNNTAGYNDGGSSIYATSLIPCLWNSYYKNSIPSPEKLVFCWNRNWSYIDSDCEVEVSSGPASYNMTHTGSYRYNMSLILGKKQLMPIEMLGDKGKNQTQNAIFNLWSHSPDIAQIPSDFTYVADNTILLHGTPNSSAILAVETISPRIIYTEIKVDILPCPPGFTLKNGTCICNKIFRNVIQCNQGEFLAMIRRGLWIGEDPFTNEIVVGIYPYTKNVSLNDQFIQLPNTTSELDDLLCAPVKRTGAFCGECRSGHAPSINSFLPSCVKCTHTEMKYNWVFYILSEIFPVTIFFLVIIFFHISVTRGSGNSFVLFAQLLTTTFDIDGDGTIPLHTVTSSAGKLKSAYEVLYGIWNLNFFSSILPEFCLGTNLNTLTALSLHYILALYSLLLILVFYCVVWLYDHGIQPFFCLCKPVHRLLGHFRRRWNLNRSIIDAFATFLVLSYSRFTVVSVYLLTPVTLQDSSGSKLGSNLYFQGNIGYLSKQHAPFFVLAVFVLVTFVLLPPVLLLVYPLKLLERVTSKLGYCGGFFRSGSRMQLFLDTFQGCFKDGTNGTRDCRYFAGLYFLLRTFLFTTYIYSGVWFQQFFIQQLVCTIAILLFAIIRPYKDNFYNNLDTMILGILAVINALSIYNTFCANLDLPIPTWSFVVQYILIYCPLIYMIGYVMWQVVKSKKVFLLSCLKRCLNDRITEKTGLLSNVLTSETLQQGNIDDEYQQFANEVEAIGRDREKNSYMPRVRVCTSGSHDDTLS